MLRTFLLVLALAGSVAAAQEALVTQNQALQAYQEKKYEEALGLFKKASDQDPSLAQAWQGQGNCLYFLGRKQEALPAFEKALALDPSDDRLRAFVEKLRKSLGSAGGSTDDLGLGLVEVPKAVASPTAGSSPELEALLREGERRLASGDPWGAVQLGEKAMALSPAEPRALNLLSRAYREAGLDHLARAVEREAGLGGTPLPKPGSEAEAMAQPGPQGVKARLRHRYRRSSGGRALLALPFADSISRTMESYKVKTGATVSGPSVLGDFELSSRYGLGRVDLEADVLCFSYRRGFDIYLPTYNYQETLSSRAQAFKAGFLYRVPTLGAWEPLMGLSVGYIRGIAEYSDSYGSGSFLSTGPLFEISLGAERFVGEQITIGPVLRYRVARLGNFHSVSNNGNPIYLAECATTLGTDICVVDAASLYQYGWSKAVIDMGGFSMGLELNYHY